MSLFRPGFDVEPYAFRGDHLREIAFPLGGIGTGCVSLDGRGGLRDWEIFNRPNKGFLLPKTFPLLWTRVEGEAPVARVVHGPRVRFYRAPVNASLSEFAIAVLIAVSIGLFIRLLLRR